MPPYFADADVFRHAYADATDIKTVFDILITPRCLIPFFLATSWFFAPCFAAAR